MTFIDQVLLFAKTSRWPLVLPSLTRVYAGIEEILITLVMQHERVDASSNWTAMKYEHPVDD